jgi:hypothetical protein
MLHILLSDAFLKMAEKDRNVQEVCYMIVSFLPNCCAIVGLNNAIKLKTPVFTHSPLPPSVYFNNLGFNFS